MKLDLFDLEIFKNLLVTIAEEMGSVLIRAGFSPNIKERRDLSCAIFNSSGDMIAQAAHIPIHLGSMSFSTKAVLCEQLCPGDVFILNDPFRGGTHLPDITCVSAVFVDEKPEFLLASRAHHADIGSSTPGSMPLSTTIHQEGVIIPPTKIREGGELKTKLFKEIIHSTRGHEEREGDLRAQIASLDIGESRIIELLKKHPLKKLNQITSKLLDYGERIMRSTIEKIPDGDYFFTDYLEDDGSGTTNIPINVKITIRGDCAVVDFRGSSKKVKGCINAPLSVTTSAVLYCFQCLSPDETPLNSGTLRPIEIKVDEDSVLNAKYPSAVVGGNVETSQRIADVVFGALAYATPKTVQAASAGTMSNLAFGPTKSSRSTPYGYYETIAGGMGGRLGANGVSAVQTHMTNTLNTPVEAMERELPVILESYSVRKDSGGTGKFYGGNGIIRQYKFLENSDVSLITERRKRRPWGIAGGGDGKTGENTLISEKGEKRLPSKCSVSVKTGESVRIETPGGGGWGKTNTVFFTVDAHEDIAFHMRHYKRSFVEPQIPCMITLPSLRRGGVRMVFNTVFIHPKHKPLESVTESMAQLDLYDEIYAKYAEDVMQIKNSADIEKLFEGEKIGFFTLMEGADPLSSAEDLDRYYARGVRALGLSWNNKNIFASGPESKDGLSVEGRKLMEKMNRLCVTLDLSHLNQRCFWESIELTELIPIATHSNARTLTDHPRNLYDEQLLAISQRGGITGVVFYGKFLRRGSTLATLDDIYAHIDHILSICGEDHVGIGTDMDGAPTTDFPKEMRDISGLGTLGEYLLSRGYAERVVKKIMGLNFLRVVKTNLEKSSKQL